MNILVKISRTADHFRWQQACQSCGADLPDATAPAPCPRCGGRLVIDLLKVTTLPRPRRPSPRFVNDPPL